MITVPIPNGMHIPWTEHDIHVLSQIAAKVDQVWCQTGTKPTHVAMHPEEMSIHPSEVMGLTVIRSGYIEKGTVYVMVKA